MATMTQRFQVRRMVSPVFAQLKDVVTMTLLVWRGQFAILAQTTIALVDELLERYPQVNAHSPVPLKTLVKSVYFESCHTLPNPTEPKLTFHKKIAKFFFPKFCQLYIIGMKNVWAGIDVKITPSPGSAHPANNFLTLKNINIPAVFKQLPSGYQPNRTGAQHKCSFFLYIAHVQ